MKTLVAVCVAAIVGGFSSTTWAKEHKFYGTVSTIPKSVQAKMLGVSWHKGCPVPISDLRYLTMSHWDYEGKVVIGKMIVHRNVADDVVWAFEQMFENKFPVERMKLINEYDGSDKKSIADNNTSSFNCRSVTGKKSWSKHSYGRAIDINPRTNPYVKGAYFEPKNAKKYLNRKRNFKGSINKGGFVVRIFTRLGWKWGGNWRSLKDYQHFEKPIAKK